MALLNIFRGTQAEVSARPVSDGALLFATDTKKIYLDKGSDRIEMSSVQDLSDYVTSSELEGLLATKADAAHTHADATGDASGFMSSADKTKLDGLVGLPEGGTDGQVLTKTADGEAWEDVPAPDMTGVVKTDSDGKVIAGGSTKAISLKNGSLRDYARLEASGALNLYNGSSLAAVHIEESMGGYIKLECPFDSQPVIETNGTLKIKGKSVREITDSISAPFTGNFLTTDKAVADYINSLIATDEEFDTYMGLS